MEKIETAAAAAAIVEMLMMLLLSVRRRSALSIRRWNENIKKSDGEEEKTEKTFAGLQRAIRRRLKYFSSQSQYLETNLILDGGKTAASAKRQMRTV